MLDEALGDGGRDLARHAGAQQLLGPAVETVGDGRVFLGVAHQLGHAQFQDAVLVAHDFHLAFLQRDRTARKRTRQFHFAQQGGVLHEELRMVEQVLGDGGGVQCCGGHVRLARWVDHSF